MYEVCIGVGFVVGVTATSLWFWTCEQDKRKRVKRAKEHVKTINYEITYDSDIAALKTLAKKRAKHRAKP